ncbi:MAG TPA: (d)CMP kinase [Tepidiformaceae bacterium]|nr:(d)CMP kinase [Tepidiformaceae bacterium]
MTAEHHPAAIAIDGPAASGKSTVGRALAHQMGYSFLDTGLMYRAFALAALRGGLPATEEACAPFAHRLDMRLGTEPDAHIYLGEEDVTDLLHDPGIESHVSAYSSLPAVREVLRAAQREFATRGKAVLAGRDIGAVVLPDAPLKIYLEAAEAARAQRRNAQRGIAAQEHARHTHEALSRRDRLDSPQTFIAPDAVVIDTTALTVDEVIARVFEKVQCPAN